MIANNQPVSVIVLTYNSSKYVLETLESIKAQTYQEIELIIADDCSPDNTVKLCQDWIAQNKSRFVSTKVIVPEHNTGVSANCNRADDACSYEWVKIIAGDDQLVPDCIETYVNYVQEHPEPVILFGRVEVFNERGPILDRVSWFDYDFFALTPEQQYERLYHQGNCIPAATCFYNVRKLHDMGIRNDERIPMLEDHPKWINCLNKGIRFHFVDQVTARYRVSEGSLSTTTVLNLRLHESQRRLYYYYYFDKEYKEDPEGAIERNVRKEIESFDYYLTQERQRYENAIHSLSYRLGHALLTPYFLLRKLFS